jgi:hypothetical protein
MGTLVVVDVKFEVLVRVILFVGVADARMFISETRLSVSQVLTVHQL